MIGQLRPALVPALFVLLAASACGEETNASAYDLSGIVTVERDDGSSAGLGGARVTFTSDTGLVEETTTGDDGRYEMQVLSDVAFGQVRAEKTGFTSSERTVYFDRAERRIDLELREASE
ncbi:carboxypeptidase-like regulatory domain-containing protein [Sandaracinus amylolyticus]|uniref:carboxypeptidase-like regulatory domain-containing protein n=1 Tax=Sandaracinus amylolyticus TaxID=927083 RepID=UPI001F31B0C0|nr:carboxypeptidase-like regulatory domain-containing protein [Sandaracinus amylolyticus]